jgi:hypothetical protein
MGNEHLVRLCYHRRVYIMPWEEDCRPVPPPPPSRHKGQTAPIVMPLRLKSQVAILNDFPIIFVSSPFGQVSPEWFCFPLKHLCFGRSLNFIKMRSLLFIVCITFTCLSARIIYAPSSGMKLWNCARVKGYSNSVFENMCKLWNGTQYTKKQGSFFNL